MIIDPALQQLWDESPYILKFRTANERVELIRKFRPYIVADFVPGMFAIGALRRSDGYFYELKCLVLSEVCNEVGVSADYRGFFALLQGELTTFVLHRDVGAYVFYGIE